MFRDGVVGEVERDGFHVLYPFLRVVGGLDLAVILLCGRPEVTPVTKVLSSGVIRRGAELNGPPSLVQAGLPAVVAPSRPTLGTDPTQASRTTIASNSRANGFSTVTNEPWSARWRVVRFWRRSVT